MAYLLLLPDPVATCLHISKSVSGVLCGHGADSVSTFDERSAAEGSYGLKVGSDLVRMMIGC